MPRILVLDKPERREELAVVLEFAGNRCSTASSLREAVNIPHKDSLDLVLIDRRLYKNNSEYVVKPLKGVWPEMPVLVITEEGQAADGANQAFPLHRPLGDLFRCIKSVLRHAPAMRGGAEKSPNNLLFFPLPGKAGRSDYLPMVKPST